MYTKLLAAGMGSLRTVEEILQGRADGRGEPGPRIGECLDAGGLFAVRHKQDKDRLIYDRRPRNNRERRINWARLPAGSQWGQTVIPPGFCLRGSLDDLSVYF